MKKRLLNEPFDFPEDESVIDPREKKKKDAERTLIDQHLDFSDAVADYNQLKQSIEATMKCAQCTFEIALDTMFYTKIWEKACQRLENVKKVLKINHEEDNLSPI